MYPAHHDSMSPYSQPEKRKHMFYSTRDYLTNYKELRTMLQMLIFICEVATFFTLDSCTTPIFFQLTASDVN